MSMQLYAFLAIIATLLTLSCKTWADTNFHFVLLIFRPFMDFIILYYTMAAGLYEFKELRNIDRRVVHFNLKKKE